MQFETKIAVVLRDDLAVWQKTNVTAIDTYELFETGHDDANRAAVVGVAAEQLDLVGIAFRADRKTVDKVVDRLRLHP